MYCTCIHILEVEVKWILFLSQRLTRPSDDKIFILGNYFMYSALIHIFLGLSGYFLVRTF